MTTVAPKRKSTLKMKAQVASVKKVPESSQKFASVFDAIADTPQEAANLRARAELARQIKSVIKDRGWTQEEAATRCSVTQPRISDLMNGRLSKFSLDALVNIGSALGEVSVELKELEVA